MTKQSDRYYIRCKDCGKKFLVSHNQTKAFDEKNRPLPVKCKECRIGKPIIEGNSLLFKGNRSISFSGDEYVIKKNSKVIVKNKDTDFLSIIKLCVGILPDDPEGLIMKYYDTVVNH